jgi:hypothetical protein
VQLRTCLCCTRPCIQRCLMVDCSLWICCCFVLLNMVATAGRQRPADELAASLIWVCVRVGAHMLMVILTALVCSSTVYTYIRRSGGAPNLAHDAGMYNMLGGSTAEHHVLSPCKSSILQCYRASSGVAGTYWQGAHPMLHSSSITNTYR